MEKDITYQYVRHKSKKKKCSLHQFWNKKSKFSFSVFQWRLSRMAFKVVGKRCLV